MQNVRLNEHKMESRLPENINNLRYADDTTLMAKRKEKLKSLFMNVKEESEEDGLKINVHVLPILIPPSTSLSTRSLWVFPVYHSFLMYSSADGHLGCFHVLARKICNCFLKSRCIRESFWNFLENTNAQVLLFFSKGPVTFHFFFNRFISFNWRIITL